MKVVKILVVLGLLTGCSAASQSYTAIPGKGHTAEAVSIDTAECESAAQAYKDKHASAAIVAAGWLGALTNHNAYGREYQKCMTAKGYTFKD
jgi:uncharacterized lipoprotein YajG